MVQPEVYDNSPTRYRSYPFVNMGHSVASLSEGVFTQTIPPQGDINMCHLWISYWDVSLWTTVMDRPTSHTPKSTTAKHAVGVNILTISNNVTGSHLAKVFFPLTSFNLPNMSCLTVKYPQKNFKKQPILSYEKPCSRQPNLHIS